MKFELTILGCGSAYPIKNRNCTAQVLNVLERYFLIDCGEATQHQLRRFGIPYTRISHIFISHLHGDHFLGLYGLLSTLSMQGREYPMHIYADARLKELIEFQFKLLNMELSYPLEFHPLSREVEVIYEDNILSVTSLPLKHAYDTPCCGFLFREKERPRTLIKSKVEELGVPVAFMQYLKAGEDYVTPDGRTIPNGELTYDPPRSRSYAFITDTLYLERVAEWVKGVDMLYHEATYGSDMVESARKHLHSTAAEAAKCAMKAGVGKLILGHYSSRYQDLSVLLSEAKEIFSETYLAEDGKLFEVPTERRIFVG